jgi:hypothetical protein
MEKDVCVSSPWFFEINNANSAYEFIIDDGVVGFYLKDDENMTENKSVHQSA